MGNLPGDFALPGLFLAVEGVRRAHSGYHL